MLRTAPYFWTACLASSSSSRSIRLFSLTNPLSSGVRECDGPAGCSASSADRPARHQLASQVRTSWTCGDRSIQLVASSCSTRSVANNFREYAKTLRIISSKRKRAQIQTRNYKGYKEQKEGTHWTLLGHGLLVINHVHAAWKNWEKTKEYKPDQWLGRVLLMYIWSLNIVDQ